MKKDLDPQDFHRTDDMALVTFLKMEGFTPQKVDWVHETCYWFFRVTDGMLGAMEVFEDGDARVEPREYNRVFNYTKREFYHVKDAAAVRAS